MISSSAVHRLLVECGFRDVLWPSPLGQQWGVVGELPDDVIADGKGGPFGACGPLTVVTCMPVGRNGFRLHVAPAAARDWLRELLARNGAAEVVVTTEPLEPVRVTAATPWLFVGLGAGAIALFGYVMSTIAATGALHR